MTPPAVATVAAAQRASASTTEAAICRARCAAGPAGRQSKIHRVDPDFGSTLAVSNRDSQPNCWVN
jgi:hypothetical protein